MPTAESIVSRHWSDVWRAAMAANIGRQTKARRLAAQIAEAKRDAVEAIVTDLRRHGYDVSSSWQPEPHPEEPEESERFDGLS